MASAGLGVAAVPRLVAAEDGPRVAVVELEGALARRTVALAWRPGGRREPAAAFAAFVRRAPPAARADAPEDAM
jgi:DNA-binding transcriptional LysR family regulator